MATFRYLDVRRDIYDQCSKKVPRKYRTFADMRRVFTIKCWLLFIGMIVNFIVYIIFAVFRTNSFYWLCSFAITLVLNFLAELWSDSMYNPLERSREIEEHRENLERYIEVIQTILSSNGIETKAQRDVLRRECEQQLSIRKNGYIFVSNKAFEMLIGVPLGALISALIYKSEGADIVLAQVATIVILGFMLIGILNIFRIITYYSEGRFKDQYLLNVLNEIEYVSE